MPRLFAVQLKDGPAERYEQWVNTPVYTHDYEDCVGWLGCELPEGGHSCEFAELAGDGAVTCASSSKVNRLRNENAKLREQGSRLFDKTLELGTENEKLRELVRDMRKAFIHNACYRWCEYMPEPCNGACQYLCRIKELGIEG